MKKPSAKQALRVTRMLGFTLIELMIVVAIVAILSAIAYPSYVTYVTKSRRVAAEGCLSQYANYMERYYTTNLRYDQDLTATPNTSLPPLDCSTSNSYYSYNFPAAPTPSAFIVQAVPLVPQSTRDLTCGTLTLDQTGAKTAKGAAVVAGSGCW